MVSFIFVPVNVAVRSAAVSKPQVLSGVTPPAFSCLIRQSSHSASCSSKLDWHRGGNLVFTHSVSGLQSYSSVDISTHVRELSISVTPWLTQGVRLSLKAFVTLQQETVSVQYMRQQIQ